MTRGGSGCGRTAPTKSGEVGALLQGPGATERFSVENDGKLMVFYGYNPQWWFSIDIPMVNPLTYLVGGLEHVFSRERLRRVLRKKAAVILHLHTFTSADLDLHTFTPADLDLHTFTSADLDLHTFTPSHLQI